jgi:predicted nucleic acid-binding Zn ribbon protein
MREDAQDFTSLGSILSRVLRERGISRRNPVGKIEAHWGDLMGEEIQQHTRILGYRRGVLGVEVDSAPWLQELSSFRRGEILARLQERLPEVKVHDIKFSIRG